MSEQLDSLRSTQLVRFIDAVCEGEIKGLVNGLRSIYINDTPLENSDGSQNFQGLSLQGRAGTADQTPMEGFGEVETAVAVGVEVKYNLPIVRTITHSLADSVRVTIGTNSLVQFKDNGDIVGSEVHYEIAIQNNGGGFQVAVMDSLNGKTTSAYRRSHRIQLPPGGPWDIRVRKFTQDSTSNKHSNGLIFDSYAAIVESKLAYPHTAVVGISIDARHFSQVPTRAYHLHGKIIRVPSNYDPVARTYDGIWDGTFKKAYSNNPAWCFYDLLTAKRYGLGLYLDEAVIDRWELYAIGKYCDQMVPDGRGGFEPRFTCSLVLQTREEALQVLQNMASIFRGVAYWGAAGVVPVQDRLQEPVALFTNANVIDGEFSYSGTSLRARHTVALVSWNDPEDMYRQKIEYVQDDEAVAKWGAIPSEASGFGCNSRGQAARAGRWLLATEKAEDEIVTFKTGFEGGGIYPGAVISTSDINRTLARFCGRICLSTAANIELDAPIKMKEGVAYQLMVTMPDGKPQRRAIVSAAGETKTVTVSPPFDDVPLVDASFAAIEGQAEPEQWRVVALEENEDASITVTALKYNKSKYDAVEHGLKLDDLPPTNLRATPQPPTDLKFMVNNGADGLTGLLSWAGEAPRYIVRWRYADDSWTEQQVEEQSLDFRNLRIGKYTFTVAAVNALGLTSRQTRLEFEVTPQAVKLPSVTGLALEGRFTGETAKFKWGAVPGATGYTVRVIVGGQVKREVAVGDALRFDYSAADMRADGGPWRGFEFAVKATGRWGSESDWASISVGNRQASAPIAINVRAGLEVGYVSLTAPPEDDIVGMVVWCSPDPNCPAVDENKVYDGLVGMVTIAALADGSRLETEQTYYVRAAVYDSFGRDGLNVSTAVPFTPLSLALDAQSITAEMIKDGILDVAKFAQGLDIVTVWPDAESALPSERKTSVLTWRGKLYRWNGSRYTSAVGAGDLDANSVTAGTIAAGAVGTEQLASNAIVTKHLAVGDLSNIIRNGNFLQDTSGWTGRIYRTGNVMGVGRPGADVAGRDHYYGDWFEVEPGDQYWGALKAFSHADYLHFGLLFRSGFDAGSESYEAFALVRAGGEFREYSGTVTVPEGAVMARVMLRTDASEDAPVTANVTDLRLHKVSGAVLIQDGAVTAHKLAAESVRGNHIAANEVKGLHVAAKEITGDHVQTATLNSRHFTSGLGSGNLIPNAGLIPGWVDDQGRSQPDGWGYGGVPNAYAKLSDNPLVKPPGTEVVVATFPEGVSGDLYMFSEHFPATPNTWYEIHALGGVEFGDLFIYMEFRNAAGVQVPSAEARGEFFTRPGEGLATQGIQTWKRMFGLVRSPASAVSALFIVRASTGAVPAPRPVGLRFTRPYVGVAINEHQAEPSPWAPSGLGTQISGGAIKTNSLHVSCIAAETLSAIRSNLGSVTSGDIHSSVVRGGGFAADGNWPAQGRGYHLGDNGLRMGNRNSGRFVEITSDGDMFAPGLNFVNGQMTLDALRVVKSSNISGGAISRHFSARGNWGHRPSLAVTAHEECTAIVSYGCRKRGNGWYSGPDSLSLRWNGAVVDLAPCQINQEDVGSEASHYKWEVIAHKTFIVPCPPGVGTLSVDSTDSYIDVALVFR